MTLETSELQMTLQKFENDSSFELTQVSGLELHGLKLIADNGEQLFSLEGNVSDRNDLNIDYFHEQTRYNKDPHLIHS